MDDSSKIYADFTLSRINRELSEQPLTDVQRLKIRKALIATESESRHTVDFRLSLPLGLRQYYLVVFAGRDRRSKTLALERARFSRVYRRILRSISVVALILLSFFGMMGLVWGLYLLKSAMGIDLIPNWHFSDFARNLFN